jgi:thiamine biosynthesis lipoprotein
LLKKAFDLHVETEGAFDIALAPLMKCWGFVNQSGSYPTAESLKMAREQSGMHLISLDPDTTSISFSRPGVMIDLGAIGKGYAIEEAMHILIELGITRAFLHGGTSTMYALGRPLDDEAWKVAIPYVDPNGQEEILAVIDLVDASLSVSAVSGKSFSHEGEVYGHVMDPREGKPVKGAELAAVVLPSATESDALSTALLVLGHSGLEQIRIHKNHLRGLVLYPTNTTGIYEILQAGIPICTHS